MVIRGHVLFVMLLPVLAQVAADDAEEQMMSEVIRASSARVGSDERTPEGLSSGPSSALMRPQIPNTPTPFLRPDSPLLSLPPSILLRLLQSSEDSRPASPQHAARSPLASPPSEPTQAGGIVDKSYEGSEAAAVQEDAEEEEAEAEVDKRVFCNGFTGCGGRHRDRSRRQERYGKRLIPLLVKRPFCNTYGCYNGKRSTYISSPSTNGIPALARFVDSQRSFRTRTIRHMLAAAASARRQLLARQRLGGDGKREGALMLPRRVALGGRSLAVGKRLFCNGYGGCRSMKRSLFSPWISRMNGVTGEETRRRR